MIVHRDLTRLPDFNSSVVTIGSFDGLHLGHSSLIHSVVSEAKTRDHDSIVVTFDPHPRHVIFPYDDSLKLLTSLEEKITAFEASGIDHLVVIPFTEEFGSQSAEEYIEFMVKTFDPRVFVIGFDHKFGNKRSGDVNLLRKYSDRYDFEVKEFSKQKLEEVKVSSTRIRSTLLEGQIELTNALLGRPYRLGGRVAKGKQIGRTIGFPTANLVISEKHKLIPANGIYCCNVFVGKDDYKGMLYIGTVPTLTDEGKIVVEVNILSFDQDIYGQEIYIEVLHFIRSDEKFDDLESLKLQIQKDKEDTLTYFDSIRKKKGPRTSIAILNYNTKEYLDELLPGLYYSGKTPYDICVIDNNSIDESCNLLREWYPDVKLISLPQNLGYAGGYNLGLKDISSEYIALINSDIKVDDNWLDPLVDFLDSHPEYAGAMPKILSLYEPDYFEYAGAAGGFMDVLAYPFCRGRIMDSLEKDEGQYDTAIDVAWLSGAAFVIRKELFDQIGGFDADYFAHQEEIDLCWRLRNLGYKLRYLPETKVWHVGGGTLDYESPRKVFFNFRNSLVSILKNESGINSILKVFLRLLLDGIAGLKFLLELKPKSTWAIVKAHFSFYASLKRTITKRNILNNMGSLRIGPPDRSGVYDRSILWSYFVRGIKKFSQLKF